MGPQERGKRFFAIYLHTQKSRITFVPDFGLIPMQRFQREIYERFTYGNVHTMCVLRASSSEVSMVSREVHIGVTNVRVEQNRVIRSLTYGVVPQVRNTPASDALHRR